MYEHVEEVLSEATFLHDTNRVYWMRNIRQFLGRMRLKRKEASMIRGVCRKLLWHNRQGQDTGLAPIAPEPDQPFEKTAQ
jgi:tRNA/rRNA methyltransferase